MATTPWAIPTGKAITGATYIKDTDNNIAATLEDLVDWCNNANGTYNDYTLTGLRTDFLSVSTAQAITSVKTVDTGGAIDFTNGELRIGGVAVTSTAAELNNLDGYTGTVTHLNYINGLTSDAQTQLNGKASLTGATFTGQVKGITPVSIDDLTRKDYVDTKLPLAGGTVTGQIKGITPVSAEDLTRKDYVDTAISDLVSSSGSYTPSATLVTNMDTVTPNTTYWIRKGNIVTMNGSITVNTTTANVEAIVLLSIPIASNFTAIADASGNGVGYSSTTPIYGVVYGNITNDKIEVRVMTATTSAIVLMYSVSYIVK